MPRPVVLLLAVPAAVAAAVLLTPAAAPAAVIGSVLLPCHSNSPLGSSDEPIETALTGGTPGAPFRLLASLPGGRAGGVGSVAGVFDAAGDATARIVRLGGVGSAVSVGRSVELAVQAGAAAPVTIGQTLVTNLTVDVATRPARVGARRRIRVSGTPFADLRLSAFLVRASGGKVIRRVSLGTANPCGYVARTVAVAPRRLTKGAYRVYVNAGTKLRRSAAVYDRFRVR